MSDDQFSKRLEELFSGAGQVRPDPDQQPPTSPAPATPAAPLPAADAAAQARLTELEAAVAEAQHRAEAEQAQRAVAAAELRQMQAALAEAQRRAEDEQARRATAAAEMQTLQAAVAEAERRAKSEQSQLSAAGVELQALQARMKELDGSYQRAATAAASAEAAAQARLQEMQTAVAEAQRRAEAEQAQRAAAAAELDVLRATLAEVERARQAAPAAPAAEAAGEARLAEMRAAVAEAERAAEDERALRAATASQLQALQARLSQFEAAPRAPSPALVESSAPRSARPAADAPFTSQPTNIFDLPGLTRPASAVGQAIDAKRHSAAFRTAVLTAVAVSLFGLLSSFNYLRTGETPRLFGAIVIFTGAAVMGAAANLIRRGRRLLGVWLILGAISGIGLFIVSLLSGIGLLLAVFELAIVSALASQALNSRQATRAVAVAVVSGLGLVLLDFYGAASRLTVVSPAIVYAGIGILLVLYAVVIAGQFANYSLRTKIVLGVLATAGAAVAVLAYFALSRTQFVQTFLAAQLKTAVSQQAEEQLRNTVASQALTSDADLQQVTSDLTALAAYRSSVAARSATLGLGSYWDARARMTQLPEGQWGNLLGDIGSVFVPTGKTFDDALVADLNASAYLDFVAPALLRAHPVVVALYYSSTRGTTTYYPNTDLVHTLPADLNPTAQAYFTAASPANNPTRQPVWTVPYQDPAGTGLIVTNSMPVYSVGGDFIGVMAADVKLARISTRVADIKIGQSGYAFLLDPIGRVIAMPAAGYKLFDLQPEVVPVGESPKQTVLGKAGRDLQNITRRMTQGEAGLANVDIGGVPHFVAFAPLPTIRYSLGVIVPVTDLTSVYASANRQIVAQTSDTIRLGVVLLAGLMLVAALLSLGLGQIIAAPLVRLTQTAEQITAGHLTAQARVETEDETGTLARAFNTMTAQLRSNLQGLEERVGERTRDLSLAAEVGQRVSAVRDLDVLLPESVETVRARFNLYYTQVYLTDPGNTTLVLRAGTGLVGQELLRRGHRLAVGLGSINGTAVTEKRAVLVEDTHDSTLFRPNPLLPDTRSEVAVPLLLGERVVGVLDLQSAQPGAFTAENLPAFQTLAGQLAVAIENASLFAAAEAARAEVEQQARRLSREGWQGYLNAVERAERVGFAYDHTTLEPMSEPLPAAGPGRLEVPITVTGESVGALQLEAEAGREWSAAEKELAEAVAQQVAQQVENLRLLTEAERSRATAEQATRRLTREGWDTFSRDATLTPAFEYDLNQVQSAAARDDDDDTVKVSQPLVVRGETVGELQVLPAGPMNEGELELMTAVAGQLSAHIENLRLYSQAEINAQQARSLIEHAPEAVVVVDADTGLFDDPNRNAELLYGLPRAELVRVGPAQMSPERQPDGRASAEAAREKILEAMNGGAPVFEWTHRNALGQDIPCEIRLVRMPSPGRNLVRASVTDITERKRAQTALARRALELETVAEVSTVASTILEAERLLQEVVDLSKLRFGLYHAHIYLIDETSDFLHLAVGSGDVGRQMVAQRHTIPVDREQSLVARAARTQAPVVVNDVRADPGFLPNPFLPGTRAELALPLVVGSRLLGVLDVQSDQVNRFSAEDVRVQSTLAAQVAVALQNAYLYAEQAATVTRLREIDHLKSSFLANMSHELRTPLNSILGFTDVMLEGLDGDITDRMETDLKVIQKNGQHLLNLINDVLDMAKIEAGKLQLAPETLNLEEVFDEVLSITGPMADAKSVRLLVDPASSPDLDVEADRFRLRQVMLNLVNNAIKFTDSGQVTIKAVRNNGSVRVSVHDTGLGIPADHLELIFQEFTQVDVSTTRKVGGTGLGLPISRKLVELHGGRLWAESEGVPGQGSTLIMELPVQTQYQPLPEQDAA